MAQNEYIIEIDLSGSEEEIWNIITDFRSYPNWNSVLRLVGNDGFEVGEKFQVTILERNGKKSRFKARLLAKNPTHSFAARQLILHKFIFSATHYFIIQSQNGVASKFIQKWELEGILSRIFKKQIFRQLARFKDMNEDLKKYLEG